MEIILNIDDVIELFVDNIDKISTEDLLQLNTIFKTELLNRLQDDEVEYEKTMVYSKNIKGNVIKIIYF